MLSIESRLTSSLKKQRLCEKQYAAAEPVVESQFNEMVYRRITESLEQSSTSRNKTLLSVHKRKLHIRTEEDPMRVIAWAIAQRIREARERQELRQEDLAKMTGIARPNIVRIEQGRHVPSLATLRKIANALQLEISSLTARPEVTKEDRQEFAEMAESGMGGWGKTLEEEDKRD